MRTLNLQFALWAALLVACGNDVNPEPADQAAPEPKVDAGGKPNVDMAKPDPNACNPACPAGQVCNKGNCEPVAVCKKDANLGSLSQTMCGQQEPGNKALMMHFISGQVACNSGQLFQPMLIQDGTLFKVSLESTQTYLPSDILTASMDRLWNCQTGEKCYRGTLSQDGSTLTIERVDPMDSMGSALEMLNICSADVRP